MLEWEPPLEKWPDLTNTEVGDRIIYCLTCNEQWTIAKEGSAGVCYCKKCKEAMRYWYVLPGEKERQQKGV